MVRNNEMEPEYRSVIYVTDNQQGLVVNRGVWCVGIQ